MQKLKFDIKIQAPAAKVFRAVTDEQLYREWASEFNPGSFFEGSWQKGEKILFLGLSKENKREGMLGYIVESIPNKQLSIKYAGFVDGDNEITDEKLTQGWAGAMEEYYFEEREGETIFKVEIDVNDQYYDFFSSTWPKALKKLKEISER